jgi:hypothetical protein
VGTLRRECLDHVLILGEQHLRRILAEYARHYNGHRPHQGLQQEPPQRQPGRVVDITARIERGKVLGGLITEYHRAVLVSGKLLVSGYRRVLAQHRRKLKPCRCHLCLFSRGGRTSALDGLCDLLGGLGGREVRGVDDLGLAV